MAAAPRPPSPGPSARIWKLPHADAVVAVADRLLGVRRRRVQATLHRAVYNKYLHPLAPPGGTPPAQPLYYEGSLSGRRYTPRLGPAGLYLSFDPSTPPAELRAVIFEHGLPVNSEEHDPFTVVAVRAIVHRVLDLTDSATLTTLDLGPDDLTADWEHEQEEYGAGRAPMPATQLLALAAHATREFAGILYPSARTDFGRNLVVFPDRLRRRARNADLLEVIDSTGRYAQRLPP